MLLDVAQREIEFGERVVKHPQFAVALRGDQGAFVEFDHLAQQRFQLFHASREEL